MAVGNRVDFFNKWQKWTIISMAITEVIIVIIFVFTELGNVACNFWLTNVFAGTWSGLVAAIHCGGWFMLAFWFTGATSAMTNLIITVVDLLGYALLISFNAVFINQPSTCVLTPQCVSNSLSTSSFSYTMSQNFFNLFNNLNGFKTYTLSQSKYLFETVQISFGCLGFVLCGVYIALYFMRAKETGNRIIPFNRGRNNVEEDVVVVQDITTGNGGKGNRKPKKTTYIS